MPGPPPRQHKHERQYTPSTHPFIPTRNDDYGGQMIFGDLVGLKFPDICLTGEENPLKKKPHPGNLSRPGIELGPAAWQARILPPCPQRWTIVILIVIHGLGHKSWQLFYFVDICERITNVYVSCGMSAGIVYTHVVNTLSFRLYMSHFPTGLVSSKKKINGTGTPHILSRV